jgi:hypothetical protein
MRLFNLKNVIEKPTISLDHLEEKFGSIKKLITKSLKKNIQPMPTIFFTLLYIFF